MCDLVRSNFALGGRKIIVSLSTSIGFGLSANAKYSMERLAIDLSVNLLIFYQT